MATAGCGKREGLSPGAVRYEKGAALAREGKVAGAVGEWQIAIALDPADPRPYFALAEQWERAGRLGEARAILERLASARPEAPHLECRLAQLLFVEGRPARALERAEKAVARDPGCGVARAVLGMALEDAGAREEALAALEKAHELAPKDERITLTLAQLLGRSGRHTEASRLAGEALAANARSADAHFMVGWVMMHSGKGQAESSLRRALALDPDYFRAHAALGSVMIRARRFGEARTHLEKARRRLPEGVEVARDLARAYRALGDPRASALARETETAARLQESYRKLRRRLRRQPEDRAALLELARNERRRGDPEEALTRVRTALRLDPNDAEALRVMHALLRGE